MGTTMGTIGHKSSPYEFPLKYFLSTNRQYFVNHLLIPSRRGGLHVRLGAGVLRQALEAEAAHPPRPRRPQDPDGTVREDVACALPHLADSERILRARPGGMPHAQAAERQALPHHAEGTHGAGQAGGSVSTGTTAALLGRDYGETVR